MFAAQGAVDRKERARRTKVQKDEGRPRKSDWREARLWSEEVRQSERGRKRAGGPESGSEENDGSLEA
jgi:hypothetical protein